MSDRVDRTRRAGIAFSNAKRVSETEKMRIELAGEHRKRRDLLNRSERLGDTDTKQTVSNWLSHETKTIEARLKNEVEASEPQRLKGHIESQKQKLRRPTRSLHHPAPSFAGGGSNGRASLTTAQMRDVESKARSALDKENARLSLRIELGVRKSVNDGLGSLLDREERQRAEPSKRSVSLQPTLSKIFDHERQPKRSR